MADICIKGRCVGCGATLIYDVITGTKPMPEPRPPTGCTTYSDGHLCEGCTRAVEEVLTARRHARTGRVLRTAKGTDGPSEGVELDPPPASKTKKSATKEGV